MKKLEINKEICTNCGLCNKVCILTKFCGYENIQDAAEDFCINCGHCVAACPVKAIEHKNIKFIEKINEIPDYEMVKNLIMKTRSVRDYKKNKINIDDINMLKKIAEYSQSGVNARDIKLLIIQDDEKLNKIRSSIMKMYDYLEKIYNFPFMKHLLKFAMGKDNYESIQFEVNTHKQRKSAYKLGKDVIFYGAPALLLFIAPEKNLIALDNATIMAQNILLSAQSLNLGGCYMGGITIGCRSLKYKPLIKSLSLPSGYNVFQALVIGHPTFQLKNMPQRNYLS